MTLRVESPNGVYDHPREANFSALFYSRLLRRQVKDDSDCGAPLIVSSGPKPRIQQWGE